MADESAAEYIGGHGSVPPPQTVSKNGPKERRRDEMDDLLSDGMEDDEKEYIEGHGTVPPPQTVSKSGPRRRGGDDLLGDEQLSSDEDITPWYHHARKGMIRLVAGGESKHVYTMGQLVRCKFDSDDGWVTGFITSVEPLQVGGSIWDQVEPVEQEGSGMLGGMFGSADDLFGGMFGGGAEAEAAEGEQEKEKPWFTSFKFDGLLSIFADTEPQKSPRHHFNEGDTLRVLQHNPEQQRKAAQSEAAAAAGGSAPEAAQAPSTPSNSAHQDLERVYSEDETLLTSSANKLGSMLGIVQQQASDIDLPPSCIKAADYVSTSRVTFDAVYMRQHAFIIDGSGSLPSSGLPFGLDWSIESDTSVLIDEFEEHREGSRTDRQIFMMEGFIPPKERSAFAISKGCGADEVQQAELSTFKANRRRRASLAYLDEEEL